MKNNLSFLLIGLCLIPELNGGNESDDNIKEYLNFGYKKIRQSDRINLEIQKRKPKLDVLGEILKKYVTSIKEFPKLDIVFLIDSSSSIGEYNFKSELKFVKKLLSDVVVDYNHTRIAVVAFSSPGSILKNIDQIGNSTQNYSKCSLLTKQLKSIKYKGGETFTLGALKKAKEIFESSSRKDSKQVLFLVTDGYSNGGDPVPVAEELKTNSVTIFTIGIQNGNYKELYDISSAPGEYYSYLLDSFNEFESLARRALHTDLKSGEYVPLGSNEFCDSLCQEGNCCDEKAICSCGTTSGHYSCICLPGFYGTGLRNNCFPCDNGTFASEPNICLPCPDPHHITTVPAFGVESCKCKEGYRATANNKECKELKCPKILPPLNGYFVKGKVCPNTILSTCRIRCEVGYALKGTRVRLCQRNGTWSGDKTKCEIKTCPDLQAPVAGKMECFYPEKNETIVNTTLLPVDAICKFSCNEGYLLSGSKERICLPIARWGGIKSVCKKIKCETLTAFNFGSISPSQCQSSRQEYGSTCKFTCNHGFQINGPSERHCLLNGHWDMQSFKTTCQDTTPPSISCPGNIVENSLPGKKYGHVTWKDPKVTDNSNLNVSVWMKPAIRNMETYKFEIGITQVYYFAQDVFQNQANCTFQVVIKDTESPIFENCVDPPIFLSNDPNGTNITWDEPIIFDNSQKVTVIKSHDYGFFNIGTTSVTYKAMDSSHNTNICILNITLEVSKCDPLPDPPNGQSICVNQPDGIRCLIICDEGYSVPITKITDDGNDTLFVCNDAYPMWYSEDGYTEDNYADGSLASECSVAQVPDEIQTGEAVISGFKNCSDLKNIEEIKTDITSFVNSEFCNEDSESCHFTSAFNCKNESFPEIIKELENGYIVKREAPRMKNGNRLNIKYQLRRKYSNRNKTVPNSQIHLKSGYKASINFNTRLNCPSGSVQRVKRCVYCPKGTFHNKFKNICESCPFGQYNNKIGQTLCIQCQMHYSTRKLRSKNVEACVEQCPPGTHARKKIQRVFRRQHNITIEKTTLKPHCSSCGIGFYQQHFGELKCVSCPEGFTTTTIGSKSIEQCIPTAEKICRKNNVCVNGICTAVNNYEFTCNCFNGYIGTYCEQEINLCLSQPCQNNGICTQKYNELVCSCKEGYTGKFCQETIVTQRKTCLNNGIYYIEDNNTFTCICPPEYIGDTCEIKINPCDEMICENNSTCLEELGRAHCICSGGFIGTRCQLLPCDYKPCIESKICINTFEEKSTSNSFLCICPEGHIGENCEEKIDYCISSPCLNAGTCINNYSNYSCFCSSLYQGSNCEIPRNTKYIFNFNTYTTSDFVKLKQFSDNLTDISACFWIQTLDDVNYGTIISYATNSYDNAFTMTDYTGLVLYINNQYVVTDIRLNDGLWHHLCLTWSSLNGTYRIYLDTKLMKIGFNLASGHQIQGMGSFILGQDQDIFGGEFSQSESFVGKLTYVDIWSKILTPDDVVTHFIDCKDSFVGDLYAWPEMKDFAQGSVKVETSDFCKTCESPKKLQNGFIKINHNVAYYSCYPGFTLSNPELYNGRKCSKASYWEGYYEPYCKRKYCGYPGSIRNGYIIGERYFFEDKLDYRCYEGYNMIGNSSMMCNENGKWSPAKPRCYGRLCIAFKQPEGSEIIVMSDQSYEEYKENLTQYDVGTQIEIICPESYNLVGESILTCVENGTWDFIPPKCVSKLQPEKMDCSLDQIPQAPPNGYIDMHSFYKASNGTINVVEYKCSDGYKLVGDNSTSCILDGYWSEPKIFCEPISCGMWPKFKNVIREPEGDQSKRSFNVGDTISFKCEDGYQKLGTNLSIRCLASGKWSRIQGKCLRKSCGKPMIADETEIEGGSYLFGDKVKLNCKSGSTYDLFCNKNGSWDGDKDDSC